MAGYRYDVRLPPAPYRFVWAREAAVTCEVTDTPYYSQRRYIHADGTDVIIRQYHVDGSFRILTDRGEVEVIDNAQDPFAPDPVSIVCLP